MDGDLVKSPPGDSFENSKKRIKKKKVERTASIKNESQVKDQTDDTLETSDKLRDFKEFNNELEGKLIDKELNVQPLDENPKTDAGAAEDPSEGNKDEKKIKKRKRIKKKAEVMNEVKDQMDDTLEASDKLTDFSDSEGKLIDKELTLQPLDENPNRDAGAAEDPCEGNKEKEKIKKRKKIKKKAEVVNEVKDQMDDTLEASDKLRDCNESEGKLIDKELTLQPVGENLNMDAGAAEDPSEGNKDKEKIKKQKKIKKKAEVMNEVKDQMDDTLEASDKLRDFNESEGKLIDKELTLQPVGENPNMDAGASEDPSEGNKDREKIKKRKRIKKKAEVMNEVKDQMDDTLEASDKLRDFNESDGKLINKELTLQPLDENPTMDAGATEDPSEENKDKKKKRKRIKKAEVMNEVKDQMDDTLEASDRLRDISESEGKLNNKEVTVQPLDENPKIEAGATEDPTEGNKDMKRVKKRKTIKKAEVMSEVKDRMDDTLEASDKLTEFSESEGKLIYKELTLQPLDENPNRDAGAEEDPCEGNEEKEKIKKRKKIKKKAEVMNEVKDLTDDTLEASDKLRDCNESEGKLIDNELIVQPLDENPNMDAGAAEDPSEGNKDKEKIKKQKRIKKKAKVMNEVKDQVDDTLEALEEIRDFKELSNESVGKLIDKEPTVQPLDENPKMDAGATEDPSEGNKDKKKIKKRKMLKEKAEVMNEVQSMNLMEMNTGNTEILSECSMNAGTTENLAACDVNGRKEKKGKRIKKKAQGGDIIQSMNQVSAAMPSLDEKCEPGFSELPESKISAQKSEVYVAEESGTCLTNHDIDKPSASLVHVGHGSPLDLCKHEETVLLSSMITVSSGKASSESVEERSEPLRRPMEKSFPCESHHKPHPNHTAEENEKHVNGLVEVNDEIVVSRGKCAAEGSSVLSSNAGANMHLPSSVVKDEECLLEDIRQYPRNAVVNRRKLLVLDVNGLLLNIIMPAPKHCRGDTHLLGRAIFKRPFCDDFLKFCFQNFDVAIWSSRSKRIIDKVVDYLLGNLRNKLLFCWDMEHSTQSGFNTLENIHKPLVFKELRKIWENNDPKFPWKRGDYDESNTLLLDDSPYKALLNPLHTAIFPKSYHYEDKNDNSLGPGGDLRVYLEGLLTSPDVRKYVQQHPFGQSDINETNISWAFYSKVLQTMFEPVAG